jgi:hypothetical protein
LAALVFGLGGVLAMQAGVTESVLFGGFLLLFLLHLRIASVVSARVSAGGPVAADSSKLAAKRQGLPPSH